VGERYAFLGFLPRREAQRAALWAELASWSWPAVAFESPQRLGASLRSLAAAAPDREVAVCRELTKRFEEVARGPVADVAVRFADAPKGEITVVIGPGVAAASSVGGAEAAAAVADLVAAGTPRRVAAEVVSRLTNVSRNDLYRGSL
jgi:16S rRNA (cytidine1402-2'-O)-methyltransferase